MVNDAFGATELRVFGLGVDYLELMDFGVDEEDVTFVDNTYSSLDDVANDLLEAKCLGFDIETSGGVHTFEGSTPQLLQIAT